MALKIVLMPSNIVLVKGEWWYSPINTEYKILDTSKPYFGISQSGTYQMFAYSKKFECKAIVLLYPWDERIGS